MKRRFFNKRASVYEYTILIIVIIGAIIVLQPRIFHAMMGRWKNAGDTFGFGRQYDPGATTVTETGTDDSNLPDPDPDPGSGGPDGPGPDIPDF